MTEKSEIIILRITLAIVALYCLWWGTLPNKALHQFESTLKGKMEIIVGYDPESQSIWQSQAMLANEPLKNFTKNGDNRIVIKFPTVEKANEAVEKMLESLK
jgi:hypothetical protein